ncbi:phosphate signaling complex protein PhoU [Novosphingobium sp.]|uniref:phosphate signaling complex protein PhoU n=1 Tax=Novosphingobium sp. TaxID=1874826 RepID=UPI0025F9295C|nr:phosphate signaling complex protein PhoU [Novosphingobium sp.]
MVAQHTVKAFDDELARLHGLIAEMGGLAELSVHEAMDALVSGNLELAQQVIERDKRIDALEAEVDRFAITVLALRSPVADDLRDVIATLKIAGIIERIGDYAKNIAKRVGQISGRRKFEPLTLLPAMNDLAAEMVHDVLTAFAARDAEAAAEILTRDSRVDAFYDSIFRNLVSYMVENPATISTAAQLLFVARNIERIGDHATNIAEVVHYSVTGKTLPEREKGPLPV